MRHTFKHPSHQSVKRAEVDEGVDDVDKLPASSCLAQVPTKQQSNTIERAMACNMPSYRMLSCMNFPFSAAMRKERKVWSIV